MSNDKVIDPHGSCGDGGGGSICPEWIGDGGSCFIGDGGSNGIGDGGGGC